MQYLLTDKPTAESVGYYRDWLVEVWDKSHKEWTKTDTYVNRTFQVWEKEHAGRESYHPSTATSILLHAINNNLAIDPQVTREPAGEGEQHKIVADLVEKRLTAIFNSCSLKEMSLPWKQIGTHLIAYGYGVVDGPSLEGLADHNDGAGRRSWNPFRIKGTHPGRVLLNPQEKQPKIAIKQLNMTAQDLYLLSRQKKRTRKYAEVFDMGKLEPMEPVGAIEFWTDFWHAVISTGDAAIGYGGSGQEQMLWIEKNPRGFVPFAHAFAGWGLETTDPADNDPVHLAQGLLAPMFEELRIQAQDRSAKHTISMENAFALYGTTQDPSAMAEALARRGIAQGQEGDFWVMKTRDVPRFAFEVSREVDASIEFGTLPRALAGFREEGVTTVGQAAINATAAQRKFTATARQMQHLATLTGQRMLRMIDTVSELEDGVMGLKKSHIYTNYDVDVSFRRVDPLLDSQRKEQGMRLAQLGFIDEETFLEEYEGREDVSKVRERKLQQYVRKHPAVLNLLAAQEARLMGEGEEVARALEAEASRVLKAMEEGQDVGTTVPSVRAGDAQRDARQEIAPGVENPPRVGA